MHSPFHSGAESANEDTVDHLGVGSFSDDGSLTASSLDGYSAEENGKSRYMDSNVYGVKKRVTKGRRLGHKTHQSSIIKPSFKKTGKLLFEAQYIRSERRLVLHVVKCTDLLTKTDLHHSNPFVRAYLVPGKVQKQQTKVRKETKEPLFNETLTFNNLEESQLQRHKMRLKVYNHSKLKKHELIGEVDIALVSLEADTKETFDADLFVKKSEVRDVIIRLQCTLSISTSQGTKKKDRCRESPLYSLIHTSNKNNSFPGPFPANRAHGTTNRNRIYLLDLSIVLQI